MKPSYRPFAVEVAAVARISPTFRRLTFTGPDLRLCGDALLDQRIKLVLADSEQAPALASADDWYAAWSACNGDRPAMRTYTVAAVDRARGTVDIDIACYPVHGPASHFARTCRVGDAAMLIAPDASVAASAIDGIAWRPGPAREFLIVGDETALPAIRNILRALPDGATGQVLVDVPEVLDAVSLPAHSGVGVEVLKRRGAVGEAAREVLRGWSGPKRSAAAVEEPDDLLWDESEPDSCGPYGWLAGEAGWLRALRRELLGGGALQRDRAAFMGYWKQGRPQPS